MNNNELLQTIGNWLLGIVIYIVVLLPFFMAAMDGKLPLRHGSIDGELAHIIGMLVLLVMLGMPCLLASSYFFVEFSSFAGIVVFLFGLVTVAVLLISFSRIFTSQRDNGLLAERVLCPNCNHFFSGGKTGDKLIGIFQKNETPTAMGGITRRNQVARYEKYELHYKCKRCNYEWKTYRTMRQ